MKIMLVNSSPRERGSTGQALEIIANTATRGGACAETVWLGSSPISDCIACGGCRPSGECVFSDAVNDFAKRAQSADGFIFASPVYYAHPTASLLAFLDRLFFSASAALRHKPAAAVFTLRRAGAVGALDAVNRHFLFAEMPIVASTYLNHAFSEGGKIEKDLEGVATLENLAKNMLWLIRSIKCGEAAGVLPPENSTPKTGFLAR